MVSNSTDSETTLVLMLSGPVAVGKSAIAAELVSKHGFLRISSGGYLTALAAQRGEEISRASLQRLGDSLDEQTDYRWLIDEVAAKALADQQEQKRWLIDSVRKARQVEHFRERFVSSVVHVHLTASEAILRDRYARRLLGGGEYSGGTSYDEACAHPNERASRSLNSIADLCIDVSAMGPSEAAARTVSFAVGRRHHATDCSD